MPIYDSSTRPAIYFKRISKRFQKSSSTDSPVLAPNLPPELWLHVVSQLETADASSLTLTCRSLCDIAQPALFENVVFNPFVDSDIISLDRPGVLNLRSESSYRKKLLRRLDFFSTPRIRHAVKQVCVGPSGKVHKRSKVLDDMVEAIMHVLPQFCNLTSLMCKHLDLTPERMSMLQQLPLKSVVLESCTSNDAEIDLSQLSLSPMPIERVSFTTSNTSNTDENTKPDTGGLRSLFLHPGYLRSLSAGFALGVLATLASSEPFGKLRELELPVLCTGSPQFSKALAHCPKLRRLAFLAETEVGIPILPSFPAETLPLLTHYRGPRSYITTIAGPRPVRHLDVTPACKPDRLIKTLLQLTGMQITRTLETLTLRCSHNPSASFLFQIHKVFPNLRNLTMKGVYTDMTHWVNMLKAASDAPHSNVRHLRMCISLSDDEYGGSFWRVPEQETKNIVQFFNQIHPLLVQAYPRLKKVQAVSSMTGALVIWRRASPSTQNTTAIPGAILEVGDSIVELGFPNLRKARSF